MLAGEAGSRGGLLSPGLSPCPCLLKIEDHSAPAFSEPQKTKSGDSLKKKKDASTAQTPLSPRVPVARTSLMSLNRHLATMAAGR